MDMKLIPDDDTKIAPDDFSQLFDNKTEALEQNIELLMNERRVGNTERAFEIGQNMGMLVFSAEVLRFAELWQNNAKVLLQLRLLFVYAAQRILQKCSPNKILHDSAVAGLNQYFDDAQPEFFQSMKDSAALSLYIYLYHHTGKDDIQSIARQFAKLCSDEENPRLIAVGARSYEHFLHVCETMLDKAEYK